MLRWPNVAATLPLAGLGACAVGVPIFGPTFRWTARPADGSDSVAHGYSWPSAREAGATTGSLPTPVSKRSPTSSFMCTSTR